MTCAVRIDRIHAKATSETDQNHFKASTGKPRPNFTRAEVEVLLQNVDMSIPFHCGYIHAIKFSGYLFIHCHFQCSYSAFIYVSTSRWLGLGIMTINVKHNYMIQIFSYLLLL